MTAAVIYANVCCSGSCRPPNAVCANLPGCPMNAVLNYHQVGEFGKSPTQLLYKLNREKTIAAETIKSITITAIWQNLKLCPHRVYLACQLALPPVTRNSIQLSLPGALWRNRFDCHYCTSHFSYLLQLQLSRWSPGLLNLRSIQCSIQLALADVE